MSLRGPRRRRATLLIATVLAVAVTACDDSSNPTLQSPTPSVDGTPPADDDSYDITEIDITGPVDTETMRATRLERLGDRYLLLGEHTDTGDGLVWGSTDLEQWRPRAGWLAGYAGVQLVEGVVAYDGTWVGAYNEQPTGMPPRARHMRSSDRGERWHEDVLPTPEERPSRVTGITSAGRAVVAVGALMNEDDTDEPLTWRTEDGRTWKAVRLGGDAGRSVAPRQPFVAGSRLLVPGAAVERDGDEVTSTRPLVWISDDHGKTYRRRELPKIGERPVALFGLRTPQAILLFGWSGTDAIVWRSEDDGKTWQAVPETALAHRAEGQSYPYRAVYVDGCVVLAGVIGDPTAKPALPAAMWRSCDNGVGWQRMATDELEEAEATSVVDLVADESGMVLVTNEGEDDTVRLLRIE